MTGTALTEEKEFRDIYGMDVIEIPTNRPVQRKDLEDAVYMTKKKNSMQLLRPSRKPMQKAAGACWYDHDRDFRASQQNAETRRNPAPGIECQVP